MADLEIIKRGNRGWAMICANNEAARAWLGQTVRNIPIGCVEAIAQAANRDGLSCEINDRGMK
jgi:hypothetical protein